MGKHHGTFWVGSLPPPASNPMIMDGKNSSFSEAQQVACGSAQKVSGIAFLNACSERLPRAVVASGARSAAIADQSHSRRIRAEPCFDYYSRARAFYLGQTAGEQAHIVAALVCELSKDHYLHLQAMMLWCLRRIDADLADRVADGLALATRPNALGNATPI